MLPWIAPSVLSDPLLPLPTSTLPSGLAFGPRKVRPLWFSKPTRLVGMRPSMSVLTTTSPMKRFLPACVTTSIMPMPSKRLPSAVW